MKWVRILVEGQTEERFVKDLLAPALAAREIFLTPTLLTTKRVKHGPNFKGGVTSYAKCRSDLLQLLRGAGDGYVTTLLDYYGLPDDFPGMATRPAGGTPLDRAHHVEEAIHRDLGAPQNLKAFLALHEFEAWLYASPSELPETMMAGMAEAETFANICRQFPSPEHINDSPVTAPSKRILTLFPSYRKALHGPMIAKRIGLEPIRKACPHFDAWVALLESL